MEDELKSYYAEMKKLRQEKNSRRLSSNTQKLRDSSIKFGTYNHGVHLTLDSRSLGIIDYWPSTDLWIVRRSRLRGNGVENLIQKYRKADAQN